MPITFGRRILEVVLFLFAFALMANQGFAFSEEWKGYDVLNFPTGFCEKISSTDSSLLSGVDRAFLENMQNGCKKNADTIPLDGDLQELMSQSLQIQDPALFEFVWMLLPRDWKERNEFVKILAEDDHRMKQAVEEKLTSGGGLLGQFIKISLKRDIFDFYARSAENLSATGVQSYHDYVDSLEGWQMNDTILSTIIDTWYYSTVSLSGFVIDPAILEKDRMHPSKETVEKISSNIMVAGKDGFSIKYVWFEKNALVSLWKSDKESFQEALAGLMRLRPQGSIAFFSKSFFAGFEKNPSFITDSKEFTEPYKNLASSLSKLYNTSRKVSKDNIDAVLGELEAFLKALGEYPKDSINLKAKTGFSFFRPAVRTVENCLLVDNNRTMGLLQKYDETVRSFAVLRDAGSQPPQTPDGSGSVNNASPGESSFMNFGQKGYGYIVWGIFLLIVLLILIYAKRKNI